MLKKILLSSFLYLVSFLVAFSCDFYTRDKKAPERLDIGYSISILNITPENMSCAKSAGIQYIETSFGGFIDENRNFKVSEEEIIEKIKKAKKAADDAGIKIWSVHMPFGKNIDLSLTDESERRQVLFLQKKIIQFCSILQPKIILFHPSFYLGINERENRKNQLIKSSLELNQTVKSIRATMVIENMLGYELMLDEKQERPLCRTVEETVEIMNRLPADICSAIDMNHIKNPEKLILAMGKRLKSIHVSDGDGKRECHFFPCSGQGENNWVEILSALQEVHYSGPFMYEVKNPDVTKMKSCYEFLYNKFLTNTIFVHNY